MTMKIVHTADWHVGKSIRGRHRGDEYREVLEELKEFIVRQGVDILLVAGDIFDSTAPSAGAEDIVYNFFHDISVLGVRSVVIAGNHDSGLRFEAIANLLKLAGVTICGFFSYAQAKRELTISVADGSQARIVLVPFVPERTFIRAEDLLENKSRATATYSREMGKLFRQFCADLTPKTVNIVMAHLLMHGARVGGGERSLYLGDNYAVYPEEIPANINYLALGHIHLYQQIPGPAPIYYSGSPLQMDFGETETPKGFLFFEAFPDSACQPQFIEFRTGKKLIEIKGTVEEITTLAESDPSLKNAYLKMTVHADASSMGLSYQLKKLFPEAVEIRREYATPANPKKITVAIDWLPALYKEYYRKQHEEDIPEVLLKQFNELYKKCGDDSQNKSD